MPQQVAAIPSAPKAYKVIKEISSQGIPWGKKCHSSYFDVYPRIWRRVGFVEINDDGEVTF
jgi:hypothetical protein